MRRLHSIPAGDLTACVDEDNIADQEFKELKEGEESLLKLLSGYSRGDEPQKELPVDPQQYAQDAPILDIRSKQQLLINMLQDLKQAHEEHHSTAALRSDVVEEGEQGRRHTEQQLRATIKELQTYLDKFSIKRQLTIYSVLMLGVACAMTLAVMISGSFTITTPVPEISVIVAVAFLFMARYAPDGKR